MPRQHSPRPLFTCVLTISAVSVALSQTLPAQNRDTSVNEAFFQSTVQPILESGCISCHNETTAEGDLRLDSRSAAIKGGENGSALVPGKPSESALFTCTVLPSDDAALMPPESPLDASQIAALKQWITDGATWPEAVKLKVQSRIDFAKHVQPILETQCVSCHDAQNTEGGLDLSSRASALSTGDTSRAIVPFHADESPLYTLTVLEKDDGELMPPVENGGPLATKEKEVLRLWIAQGAVWPEKIKLQKKAKKVSASNSSDDMELVQRIHQRISDQLRERAEAEMKSYTGSIPITKVDYEMVAIPSGKFLMGSPEDEPNRSEIEGPQREVTVDPFWIGKCEVTWDEYEPFMITQVDREKHGARKDWDPKIHTVVDGVSQPTPPYTEMSFGMGQRGYPAISMTQHAANKYCQWLSAQTGHFYRLPTEAEWEYACRAGTTSAYSFGDEKIDDYAWYYENSNEKYQKVGKKKPNPWGLHDMHGNVMEWTADRFEEDYFDKIAGSKRSPFLKPSELFPRTVRGGGWDDDPEQLRSAFRRGSGEEWKQQDPQLPQSIWYHTNAQWLGFRIVRPLKVPSLKEAYFYWNSATDMQ